MIVKDPVCGMDVDTTKARATSTYQSKSYYFCAPGCKVAFDRDPERYVGKQASDHGHMPQQHDAHHAGH